MTARDSLQMLNRQLSGMKRPMNLNSAAPLPAEGGEASTSKQTLDSPSTAAAPAATNGPLTKRKRLNTPRKGSTKPSYDAPKTRLSNMGGVDGAIEQLLELVALPVTHPEIYTHTGVRPPRGVLLVGPPGCGKTMLAGAIAGELGCPFISVSAPSIVSGMSGESEKTLRETFEEAARQAPCILFIDEIDAITPKRENAQREMERRIVAQFLTCMDDLAWDLENPKPVIVLGATNRPDSLDPALRRAGRFDAEVSMGVPDQAGRERILSVLMEPLRLSGEFDMAKLAQSTPGYVGADLSALTGAAGIIAVKRIFEQLAVPASITNGNEMAVDDSEASAVETLFANLAPSIASLPIANFLKTHPVPLNDDELEAIALTNEDFEKALSIVQPSSQREGFTTVPNVTWADLGALREIRTELRMSIVEPIRKPAVFEKLGIATPCGVLLWGPPGCGKTLLAKAVANDSMANFISVKGPELLNKYVGESERAVRQVFARARASSPCIIFFDELDALVPKRDDALSESSARVVNTLLTELDGLSARKQVYVVGATNRPDILDPAMCRPGRLDKLLYVDLPSADERVDILRTLTRKTPLGADVDLDSIARSDKADGFSGADLNALVREAAQTCLRAYLSRASTATASVDNGNETGIEDPLADEKVELTVEMRHFEEALDKTNPSVSKAQRRRFEALRLKMAGLPVGHAKERLATVTGAGAGYGAGIGAQAEAGTETGGPPSRDPLVPMEEAGREDAMRDDLIVTT